MFNMKVFYNKVNTLCRERGTTITQVAIALGLSTATGTNWKRGKIPSAAIIKMLSDHLDVSADYLLSEDDDIKHQPLSDNETELIALFKKLDKTEQYKFIGRLEEIVDQNKSPY